MALHAIASVASDDDDNDGDDDDSGVSISATAIVARSNNSISNADPFDDGNADGSLWSSSSSHCASWSWSIVAVFVMSINVV